MDRGIYSSASGGLLNLRRLEIVANNLANVSTVGFKAQRLVTKEQSFEDTLVSTLPKTPERAKSDSEQLPGVVNIQSTTDFTPGPIQSTGNPLDAALRKANQFFVVQTPQGEAYTRAGNFTLDRDGNLVTQDGLKVAGDGGDISVGRSNAYITSDGSVIAGGASAGRLRVVEIDDLTKLKHADGTRFQLEGAQAKNVDADIVPSSVEMPNVSVVEAMVDMINAQKAFEAYTKTVRTIDELNDIAIRNTRLTG